MPTTTPIYGIEIPASDLEPADMYGVATRLGNSVEAALDRPYCELASAAVTSIPHNADTKVDLATTIHNDTDNFSVAASVVTILEAGRFDINFIDEFAFSTQFAFLRMFVSKNGLATTLGNATVDNTKQFGTSLVYMNVLLGVGDTLQAAAKQIQSSGTAALNMQNVGRLIIRKVG